MRCSADTHIHSLSGGSLNAGPAERPGLGSTWTLLQWSLGPARAGGGAGKHCPPHWGPAAEGPPRGSHISPSPGIRYSTDTPHQRGPECTRRAELQLSFCPACCLPPPSHSTVFLSICVSLLSSLPPFPLIPHWLSSSPPQHSHLPLLSPHSTVSSLPPPFQLS